MSPELTRDADDLLCKLYAEYLARQKSGISRGRAKCFTDPEDTMDILRELKHAGLVRRIGWDGFALEDAAIVYMENRPGLVEKSLDVLARIKDSVPFL